MDVVNRQPQSTNVHRTTDWTTGVCECFDDMPVCLLGTFVPCVLACIISKQYGECLCLPCLPGTLMSLRTGIRERHHVQGSIVEDWFMLCCIPHCALCQMSRELKIRQ
uniref:Cornifelin n=1 Tax=Erpetoichthys calabaricus TaxID=27687 RepID=A0A8C4RWW7_ERPCA